MPRIATRNAFRLAYRQRFGAGVRMLGCLLLLCGTIVIMSAVADAFKEASRAHVARLSVLGSLLVLIGAPLLWGERGKVVDRQERKFTTWLGMVRPLWRTTHDLQPYQSVKADPYDAAGVVRWRVYLANSQGEQLEVFDLADRDAAEVAARQIGDFLSFVVAPLPAVPAELSPASTPSIAAAAVSESCWTYRRSFSSLVRLIGAIMASLAIVLLLGIAVTGKTNGRAMAVITGGSMLSLGLWFFFGCRKVAVDKARQTVRLWRAWPLPPDGYDLDAFHAVVVGFSPIAADSTADQTAETYFVGLVDREQQRLDLVGLSSREEAIALGTGLAGMLQFPLIDELRMMENVQGVGGST